MIGMDALCMFLLYTNLQKRKKEKTPFTTYLDYVNVRQPAAEGGRVRADAQAYVQIHVR